MKHPNDCNQHILMWKMLLTLTTNLVYSKHNNAKVHIVLIRIQRTLRKLTNSQREKEIKQRLRERERKQRLREKETRNEKWSIHFWYTIIFTFTPFPLFGDVLPSRYFPFFFQDVIRPLSLRFLLIRVLHLPPCPRPPCLPHYPVSRWCPSRSSADHSRGSGRIYPFPMFINYSWIPGVKYMVLSMGKRNWKRLWSQEVEEQ